MANKLEVTLHTGFQNLPESINRRLNFAIDAIEAMALHDDLYDNAIPTQVELVRSLKNALVESYNEEINNSKKQ